jgi:hypothetical protein
MQACDAACRILAAVGDSRPHTAKAVSAGMNSAKPVSKPHPKPDRTSTR